MPAIIAIIAASGMFPNIEYAVSNIFLSSPLPIFMTALAVFIDNHNVLSNFEILNSFDILLFYKYIYFMYQTVYDNETELCDYYNIYIFIQTVSSTT